MTSVCWGGIVRGDIYIDFLLIHACQVYKVHRPPTSSSHHCSIRRKIGSGLGWIRQKCNMSAQHYCSREYSREVRQIIAQVRVPFLDIKHKI